MRTCRLDLSNRIKLVIRKSLINEENILIIDSWDKDNPENDMPVTLKDISIILYAMTGCGVTRLFAQELARRLEIADFEPVEQEMVNVFRHYFEMSDDEALDRFNSVSML